MRQAFFALFPALFLGLASTAGHASAEIVTFDGPVERIIDSDTFTVTTGARTERVYLSRTGAVPFTVGEQVTVTGIVDSFPRREIYATAITRADGSELTFVIE